MTAYLSARPICEPLRFFSLVRALDRVFLDWHAAKAKAEAGK